MTTKPKSAEEWVKEFIVMCGSDPRDAGMLHQSKEFRASVKFFQLCQLDSAKAGMRMAAEKNAELICHADDCGYTKTGKESNCDCSESSLMEARTNILTAADNLKESDL